MENSKLAKIDVDSWELEDIEIKNQERPDAFFIPSQNSRNTVKAGDIIRLLFRIRTINDRDLEEDTVERLWVVVKEKNGEQHLGHLDSSPECTDEMKKGMPVFFEARHILQIHQA